MYHPTSVRLIQNSTYSPADNFTYSQLSGHGTQGQPRVSGPRNDQPDKKLSVRDHVDPFRRLIVRLKIISWDKESTA